MRALALISALVVTTSAFAEPLPDRPDIAAPTASAPAMERQAWCQQYAAWFVAHTQDPSPAPDQRATHRFEVELNSCTLDPQAYQRQTMSEIVHTTEST